MKVLNARSVRANLVRIDKALRKIEAKQKELSSQWTEIADLRRALMRQLPLVKDAPDVRSQPRAACEQPIVSLSGGVPRGMVLPSTLTTVAETTVAEDCGAPECPVHHGGNAPYCPEAAEATSVPLATNTMVYIGSLAKAANAPPAQPPNPRKAGWPKGLSRKLATCEVSPKWPAHRHRSEGTEVYCVGNYADQEATP